MSGSALHILNNVFGYGAFRGRQAEIIEQVSQGRRCLGAGRPAAANHCVNQIPALLGDGIHCHCRYCADAGSS